MTDVISAVVCSKSGGKLLDLIVSNPTNWAFHARIQWISHNCSRFSLSLVEKFPWVFPQSHSKFRWMNHQFTGQEIPLQHSDHTLNKWIWFDSLKHLKKSATFQEINIHFEWFDNRSLLFRFVSMGNAHQRDEYHFEIRPYLPRCHAQSGDGVYQCPSRYCIFRSIIFRYAS